MCESVVLLERVLFCYPGIIVEPFQADSWTSTSSDSLSIWTAGQQVERLTLHQGHDSYQIFISLAKVIPGPVKLTVQNRGLKHHSFNFLDHSFFNLLL